MRQERRRSDRWRLCVPPRILCALRPRFCPCLTLPLRPRPRRVRMEDAGTSRLPSGNVNNRLPSPSHVSRFGPGSAATGAEWRRRLPRRVSALRAPYLSPAVPEGNRGCASRHLLTTETGAKWQKGLGTSPPLEHNLGCPSP